MGWGLVVGVGVAATQCVGHPGSGGDHGPCVQATRCPTQAFQRSGDGDGSDDFARRTAHGSRDRGDSGLTFADGLGPASSPYAGQRRRVKDSALQAAVQTIGFLPGEQDLCCRAGLHRERRTKGDAVTQSTRDSFGGGNADPFVALASVQLRAFAGGVPQCDENGRCGGQELVLTRGAGQLGQPRTEDESPVDVSRHQAVELQRGCEPMGSWPGQTCRGHHPAERQGSRFERTENERCFVEHAYSARVVHVLILPSRMLRRQVLPAKPFEIPRSGVMMSDTLAEKVWNAHVVRRADNEPDLLYIDLHLVHEVTSPQAFDGLREAGRPVRRPDLTLATEDHNVPTIDIDKPIADLVSRTQVDALRKNCDDFGVRLYPLGDIDQGIVHVVGPQLGLTQPGMTVVCGDSHTATHGAFGALAFGIGTSEVEHVLATQTLSLKPFKTMAITVIGDLPEGVSAKDLILAVITEIGTGGGQGHVIEYRGEAIRALSMEARMTVCNMSIEAGARAGMIAPDETTFEYLSGRPHAPRGEQWDAAVEFWRTLRTDDDAVFDAEVVIDASTLTPFVTWGTNPGQGVQLGGVVPSVDDFTDPVERSSAQRALEYMALKPGTPMRDITVDTVFIGSCTNGRIEDLRTAAEVLRGRKVADGVRMLVVPGSARVRLAAEAEGLNLVFEQAGAEWRNAGCSMCMGMNPDHLSAGQRSASTSNRNFEGRQGPGARTHLVSPAVAAATAVSGHLASPADLTN